MKKRIILFYALPALLLFSACSHDPFDVDISATKIQIGRRNLDSLINVTDTSVLQQRLLEWHVDIPEVIDYELGYCIQIGRITDTGIVSRLYAFRTNEYIRTVEKRIQETFPDLDKRHDAILTGFRRLKTHIGDAKIPAHIVYLNSTHRASAFSTENDLAIGLEMYLGAKTDVIRQLPQQLYFEWQKEGMEERYLERDALASWIFTHIIPEKEDATVMESIISWGKIIYLTEAAFPELDKQTLLRYTKEDYDWAIEHERDFWKYLVDQKLLFRTDSKLKMNFLADAPFTAGLPEQGPDRLGQFLGWRIIHSYMDQHKLTVQEVIDLPYTELLTEYEIN